MGMQECRRLDFGRLSPSLPMRPLSSKRNFASTSSELNRNREKMRIKHRDLTRVIMEAEKGSTPLMGRPMTSRDFRARYKRLHEEKMRQENSAPRKSEKLNQGVEEHVDPGSKKKQRLKKKYPQCSPDVNYSGRDLLLDEEEFHIETSNVDRGRPPIISVNLKKVTSAKELALGKSEKSRSCQGIEEDMLSPPKKKRRLKKKYLQCSPEKNDSGRDLLIDEEECCSETSNADKERQEEFHRFWDDNMSEIDRKHKLEAAIIRIIYGKSSVTMDKLIILDNKFAKKVAQNNSLKAMQLKDLEREQLAARDRESRNAASRLSTAKGCTSDELKKCSLGSQDEEVSRCSESQTHALLAENAIPSIALESNIKLQDQVEPAIETQSSARNEVATSTVVGNVIAEQLSIRLQDGDASVAKDQVTLQVEIADLERVESAAYEVEPAIESVSMSTTEVAASENINNTTPSQSDTELQDEDALIVNNPVSLEIEVPKSGDEIATAGKSQINAPAIENYEQLQITPVDPSEVAASENINKTTAAESNTELQDGGALIVTDNFNLEIEVPNSVEDGIATALQSHINAPAIENCEQLQLMPIDPSEVAASENISNTTPAQSNTEIQDQDALIVNNMVCLEIEVSKSGQDAIQSHIDATRTEDPEQLQLMPIDPSGVSASENINYATPSQSNTELHDGDALVVDNEVSLEIEVPNSAEDEIATAVQSHIDAPAIENCEQLQMIPIDPSEVAASENIINTIPAQSNTELQDEDTIVVNEKVSLEIEVPNSVQDEIVTAVQPHIEAAAIEDSKQLHFMPIDAPPRCNNSPSIETIMPSHESAPQLRDYVEPRSSSLDVGPQIESQSCDETSAEITVPFQLPPEATQNAMECLLYDILQLRGVSDLVPRWNSSSQFPNPLKTELERCNKETAELQKGHDNTVTQLRSECEEEIRKIVAEVQNKYELKITDARAQFTLKKNELIRNQNKVWMNKLLANSFINGILPTRRPQMQQGSPSSSMQQQQHFTVNNQSTQQLLIPHSTRLGPSASQIYAAPLVQAAHHARPIATPRDMMNMIIPTSIPNFVGNINSSPRNFQASNSAAAATTPGSRWFPFLQLRNIQQQPQQPSAIGLEHYKQLPGNHSSSIAEMNSSFGFYEQPNFDSH